jgi:hypothetical protein
MAAPGPRWLTRPGDPPCQLLLEGVFDFLAGLLEVALGLVGVAFGFERLVAGDLPGGFLDLALGLLGGVLGLSLLCSWRYLLVSCDGPAARVRAVLRDVSW